MNQTPAPSFSDLLRAARGALQWRLLLLWVLLMLIPAAILTVPTWQILGSGLDRSVHAAQLAQQLDMVAFTDLMSLHGKNAAAFTVAGVLALIVTLLLAPLLSAMAASAARAQGTAGFRELIGGAVAGYLRMLRMLVWSVVPLGLAAALGGAIMEAAAHHAADAVTAADARLWTMPAMILTAILVVLAHASVDAGRAQLAIERRRSSAVKAWWAGCRLLLRRPLHGLGIYLLVAVIGLGLAAGLGVARLNLSGASIGGFIGAVLLVQLAVAVIGWMRSARLFALMALAQSAPR